MLGSIGGRAAQFVSQLILARLLTSSDFGVVGLANSITAVFVVLSDVGVAQVIQQRRGRMHLWGTQAFWTGLLLACAVALAISASAPIASAFYHNDKVPALMWIAASALPITALSIVPQAHLQARMRFRFLSGYTIAEMAATQALIVLLAWCDFGALSFVIPIPLLALVRVVVFWRAAPVPIGPLGACRHWRHMVRRGSAFLGSNIYGALIAQGGYMVLGVMAPASVVGVYFFAFKLAVQPMLMIVTNVNNVLFPTLNAVGDDPARQRQAALRASELLGIVTVPACFLQGAVAAPVIHVLFGTRWAEAVPLIQLLSLGLPFDAISWPAGTLLSARGEFARVLRYQVMFAPLFFALTIAGAHLGSAAGIAVAVSIYSIVHPMAVSWLVFSREGVSASRILTPYLGPMAIGAVTIGGASELVKLSLPPTAPLAQIALVIILAAPAYVLCVRQFIPQYYAATQELLLTYLRRRNKAPVAIA